ncbi:MAG: hypothetical protein LIO87_05085 [Eubacterium sp.]|nr:hypothetical protein [Eubacterium sp.]
MLRISGVKVSVGQELSEAFLRELLQKKLKTKVKNVKLFKKSIDARKKDRVIFNLTIDFEAENKKRLLLRRDVTEAVFLEYKINKKSLDFRPVVVGFGPAGFMAGLYLARAGLKPIILERGGRVEERTKQVNAFFKGGSLDEENNVQFGEGGAGTFSDGKLNTGVNDPRIRFVLETFVEKGAPEEILWEAKPHVGTDRLGEMVKNIRKEIISLGGEVRFNCKMTGLLNEKGEIKGVLCGEEVLPTKAVILALGHSARDTFKMLYDKGIVMEGKSFSVGVRIEHTREFIDRARYGEFADVLNAADYKLATHLPDGRGVYTFCMCPGGYVVAAASEKGGVVTNGMSNFLRDGENSNSAVLVGIGREDFGEGVLDGVEFQRRLERKAFELGGRKYFAPAQNTEDFVSGRETVSLTGVKPTYQPGVVPSDFRELFPEFICDSLRQGLSAFDRQIKGFASEGSVLTGVESRSSSPVRILRDRESLESVELKGLYPCGEGAGYAGGIMSATVDGLKCAEKICEKF